MRDHAAETATPARPLRRKPAPTPAAHPAVSPAEARQTEPRRTDEAAATAQQRGADRRHPHDHILGLQRARGNHAVQRLLGAHPRSAPVFAPAPAAIRRDPSSDPVAAGTHTITDPRAFVREGPPGFKLTRQKIPAGTRVDVVDTQSATGKRTKGTFVNLAVHGSGDPLGWTSRDNLGDVQYAKAAASFVYMAKVTPRKGHPDAIPVLVYVPPAFDGKQADIVLYLHGDAADYAAGSANNYDRENPAIGMQLAAQATGPHQVVIAPQINEFTAEAGKTGRKSPWHSLHAGDYERIVQTVLGNVKEDLKFKAPIARGAIAIAGHSGGGKGLGQAAMDLDPTGGGVTDVTLVEAGYGGGENAKGEADGVFAQSFQMVRDWLLQGKPGKVLRVISKASTAGTDTRSAIENAGPGGKRFPVLGAAGIRRAINASGRAADFHLEVTEVDSDPEKRTGGMLLIRTIVVQRTAGGPPQGTIEVYLMLNPPRGKGVDTHFGVRDATIGSLISGHGKAGKFGVN